MDTEGYSLNKFAGQEHIKDYFKEVVIDAIKEDDISIVPKGVLLMVLMEQVKHISQNVLQEMLALIL